MFLQSNQTNICLKSALGQAFWYCRNQWGQLEEFLKDGRLEINNNQGERFIKPFVIGRKD
ncbi:IS66 family transposase [Bacillus mycoides]|uniref:IS66 family transposase n=1 Tax=Bacillus mycoides TaxID=1405 RepID=UPI003D08D360